MEHNESYCRVDNSSRYNRCIKDYGLNVPLTCAPIQRADFHVRKVADFGEGEMIVET